MAQGKVQVNNLNLMQGPFTGVENLFLYIGVASSSSNNNKVLSVNADSKLDTLLGAGDSDLKTQLEAAKVNAGQNWNAVVVPIADNSDWTDAVDLAMRTTSVEAVVVCSPVDSKDEVNAAYTKAADVLATLARPIFIMLATRGIENDETWSDYTSAIIPLVTGVVANRVMVVPKLHGNDIGVLAGRLSNQSASIADSPMRVATGSLVGLGPTPKDSQDVPLGNAVLATLEAARLSVPQTYTDYPGIYWSDGNLLEVPAGDFQVIENLRVLDYCARRVRVLAIARIADRKLNSTPGSIAYNSTYFMRPLREAARTTTFNGIPFPAMILQPEEGDIVINWVTKYEVEIYISAKPHNSPKKITANLMLDLSSQ